MVSKTRTLIKDGPVVQQHLVKFPSGVHSLPHRTEPGLLDGEGGDGRVLGARPGQGLQQLLIAPNFSRLD